MSDKHFGLGRSTVEQNLSAQSSGLTLPLLGSSLSHQEYGVGVTRGVGTQGGHGGSIPRSTNGIEQLASLPGSQQPSVDASRDGPLSTTPSRRRKAPSEDSAVLKKKIRDYDSNFIHKIQLQYAEVLAHLCFVRNNGQPGDFGVWRTRLPSSVANFLSANKLNPEDETEDLYLLLRNKVVTPSNSSPIPRLHQDGSGSGWRGGSPGHSLDKRIVNKGQTCPSQRGVPSASPIKTEPSDGSTPPPNSQEQIVEQAKQEAYVMQRIAELQRDGLWGEKRLPKVFELPRPKAHWDYLLEEMVWLAADFAQERKWKKAAAKKCARMVQKYFQEKELNAQKAVRARELQLKRIASCMAKEVKQFWSNIEKLVEFKQQTRLEEQRKKALDQHLSYIVDQTEKYSSLVAESMNTSVLSSKPSSPKHHSDVEFEPESDSDDDEETIAKEEAMSVEESETVTDEVNALQRESELPLDELLKDYLDKRDQLPSDELPDSDDQSSVEDEEKEEEEFHASDVNSSDDEETIKEEEEKQQAEGAQNHKDELNELEADNNLSIEDLKEKYGLQPNEKEPEKEDEEEMETDSKLNEQNNNEESDMENETENEDEDEDDEEDDEDDEDEDEEEEEEEMDVDLTEKAEEDTPLKSLFSDDNKEKDKDQEINQVAAIAESIQPTGNTLSSTNVVTKVPFLLKHNLREYQHVGLDWLVTMYESSLNGILADEMGLGKTIQTIALLAHLACEKENWGPHLIVVPTSVMLNWEMEFKKWCPSFKILTYYGTVKERKLKRTGWTKPNAFHVCITSYKLIIQDHQSFRRKKWKYLILDEAQNIKNFKSQRWQLLLNFQTQRRLLLTGTPLQNNLMELWSLMHFLMPNVFESHREFKEWFCNPVTGMIEGNSEYNEQLIKRLHKVLRPFLLRRLKCEVETQMPKKYEHIIMCRLSNRQRYLYDDFMSRTKTRETLASGSLLSVINVLMQLRKVCNHPNLFEVRPTVSPFQMDGLHFYTASCLDSVLDYNPFKHVNLSCLGLYLVELEAWMLAFVAHRAHRYKTSRTLIEEIDTAPPPKPRCPEGKIKISVQRRNSVNPSSSPPVNQLLSPQVRGGLLAGNNHRLATVPLTRVGTSPMLKIVKDSPQPSLPNSVQPATPTQGVTLRLANPVGQLQNYIQLVQQQGQVKAISVAGSVVKSDGAASTTRLVPQIAQIVNTPSGKQLLFSPPINSQQGTTTVLTSSGQRLTVLSSKGQGAGSVARLVSPSGSPLRPVVRLPSASLPLQNLVLSGGVNEGVGVGGGSPTVPTTPTTPRATTPAPANATPSTTPQPTTQASTPISSPTSSPTKSPLKPRLPSNYICHIDNPLTVMTDEDPFDSEVLVMNARQRLLETIWLVNEKRCGLFPVYGRDVISSLELEECFKEPDWRWTGNRLCRLNASLDWSRETAALKSLIYSAEQRVQQLGDIFSRFVMYVPAVRAPRPQMSVSHPVVSKTTLEVERAMRLESQVALPMRTLLHPVTSRMATQFPDPRLIQYDCGKLQSLDILLRQLKKGHHRALVFTQMTRMLDVLEAFLNYHGHIYLRLDGTTRVEQRQVLMERFNNDRRIFVFILSTRSGGVGVNLTGADTVIFYDSDWNPTMDAQAQDRCHRIGQTRDVHIYRLISEKTVEENILKKANQKRMLGDLAIEGGNFTTAYFKSSTIQDLFNVDVSENDASRRMAEVLNKDSEKKFNSDESQTNDNKSMALALESALAQAEDETDVAAAKTAQAEAAEELAEFDENIPIDQESQPQEQLSKAELELQALEQQLSGIEKFGIRFMEEQESSWAAEQLAAAEAQLEEQKREWEANQANLIRQESRKRRAINCLSDDDDDCITYSGTDARNQEWISDCGAAMPMWCPPTPPQDDSDVLYIDQSLSLLYNTSSVIPESHLPPAYVKRERKRPRLIDPASIQNSSCLDGGRLQVGKARHKEESVAVAPRSLFDRPTPALVKMRQELRLQRYRGGHVRPLPHSVLKPPIPVKPLPEPDHVPEWVINEDWAILQAVQHIQEMSLNLMVLSPGHTPNWDMVADMVNMTSRIYRSPKQCKNRYESVIMPREEGKLVLDSPKKQKKNKTLYKIPQMKAGRPLRTSQLFQQDNNSSMTTVVNSRFDAIRSVSNRRTPTVKPLLMDPAMRNPKHAEVLADSHIDYETPLTPVEVAARRADRIAKEKQLAATHQGGTIELMRQQQLKPTIVGTTTVPNTARQLTTLTVQEMVATVGGGRTIVSTGPLTQQKGTILATSQPGSPAASQAASSTTNQSAATITTPKGTKTISAAQLAVYRQQQLLRQQQHQMKFMRAAAGASVQANPGASPTQSPKVSIATVATAGTATVVATAPISAAPRIQQVKTGSVGRPVTESEMVALLAKRQAVKAAAGAAGASAAGGTTQPLTTAQLFSVKALTGKAVTHPMRHQILQQQLLAAAVQHRTQAGKLPQQKVTHISQVGSVATGTKAGGSTPTQLIVQSATGPKTLPATMTVHQIQQVMKQVQPQHVVVTGGGGTSGVGRAGSDGTRQVALATGTLKAGQAQQQAILTQVSAVLGGGQQFAVRGAPMRLPAGASTAGGSPLVAVATTPTSTTLITIPSQPASTSQANSSTDQSAHQ